MQLPTPIFTPNEQLLKILSVGRIYLKLRDQASSLQKIASFYSKTKNYQYCIIFITTLRLLVIPILETKYSISRSFAILFNNINIKYQIDDRSIKCHFTKFILILQDANKIAINTIASTICLSTFLNAIRDIKQKNEFQHGDLLFYKTRGIGNTVLEYDDELPSYEESETRIGNFFKSTSLLDQVQKKKTDTILENAKLVLVKRSILEKKFGNCMFKFLANNCLKYTQRNLVLLDIPEVIVNDDFANEENESEDEIQNFEFAVLDCMGLTSRSFPTFPIQWTKKMIDKINII